MSNFLIYALVDPRTNEFRYIGQSGNGMRRPRQHGLECQLKRDKTHRATWIRSLRREGFDYKIHILEELYNIDGLNEAELKWIAYGRSNGWPLTNHTDGGDGVRGWHHSEKPKQRLA